MAAARDGYMARFRGGDRNTSSGRGDACYELSRLGVKFFAKPESTKDTQDDYHGLSRALVNVRYCFRENISGIGSGLRLLNILSVLQDGVA